MARPSRPGGGLWVDPDVVGTTTAARIATANPDATFYRDVDELVRAFGLRHTPTGTPPARAELATTPGAARRRSLLRSTPRWGRTVARTGWWRAVVMWLAYLLGSYNLILGGDQVRTQIGPGPHPGWTAVVDASEAIIRLAVLLGDAGGAARWAGPSVWRSSAV